MTDAMHFGADRDGSRPGRAGKGTRMSKTLLQRAAVVAASAAALAGITSAVTPAADAATYWGAIAYSPYGYNGTAWDWPTKASADQTALNYCGYSNCTVLASFTQCGAVAENSTSYQGGYGPTLSAAMNDARSRLAGSWISAWACN